MCKQRKPVTDYWENSRNKASGLQPYCKQCMYRKRANTVTSRVRQRVMKDLRLAPFTVAVRMMSENPREYADVLALVMRRDPITYKKYVEEEEDRIIAEAEKRVAKYGQAKKNDPHVTIADMDEVLERRHAALRTLLKEFRANRSKR